MTNPLDYTQLSTWENLNCLGVLLRIGCHDQVANCILGHVYRKISDSRLRAKFFLQCEKLEITGEKFTTVFKDCRPDETFASLVARLNKVRKDETFASLVARIDKVRKKFEQLKTT